VITLREQVDGLIEAHCEATAEFKHERFRVAMGELSGQPDPEVVASVEASLSKVYALLHESSERLAAISAALEFNEGNFYDG
jgi:hypothetical protein